MVLVDLKRLFKQAMSEHRPINQHQFLSNNLTGKNPLPWWPN
jgi:hypothetical protein